MKHLQDHVQGPLASMMRGRAGLPGKRGQELLTRWSVVAVMARDSADRPEDRKVSPYLPRSLRRRHGAASAADCRLVWPVHRQACSPISLRGALPDCPGGDEVSPEVSRRRSPSAKPCSRSWSDSEDVDAVRRSAAPLPLKAIWPPGSDSVEWPPAQLFTDDTFSSLVSVHMLRAF
jgi:hypothetical protein